MKTFQKDAKTHTCTKVLNNSVTLYTIAVTAVALSVVVTTALAAKLVIFV